MARQSTFGGTIFYSKEPIAGMTVYEGGKPEQSLEEMFTELEKQDLREARRTELISKLKTRALKAETERIEAAMELRASGEDKKSASPNPKRYLVDPETGKIDVVDEDGEYTYKDALLVSASIKGKTGQFDDALNLIKAAKEFSESGTPKSEEKKKEYYVDQETGVIHHDPENGEYTLSEARTVSQSRQQGKKEPSPGYFIDAEGTVRQLQPGAPLVVKKESQLPGKTFMVDQKGNLQEVEAGKPIVVRVETAPSNTMTPIQIKDQDGNPMVMDLNQLISWKKFQGDEKRADDRNSALMELTKTVKENLPDGIRAFQMAAAEMKGKGPASAQPQAYECNSCHTKFTLPREPAEGEEVECPNCHQKFPREEVMGT